MSLSAVLPCGNDHGQILSQMIISDQFFKKNLRSTRQVEETYLDSETWHHGSKRKLLLDNRYKIRDCPTEYRYTDHCKSCFVIIDSDWTNYAFLFNYRIKGVLRQGTG
jgi:hypothetical protein